MLIIPVKYFYLSICKYSWTYDSFIYLYPIAIVLNPFNDNVLIIFIYVTLLSEGEIIFEQWANIFYGEPLANI
jgi:hypothetical protein